MEIQQVSESTEYLKLIEELKSKVKHAQFNATLSVNRELVSLYFEIGLSLIERQRQYNWGEQFIESVAVDLKREFPTMSGISVRNIKYMRSFASKFQELLITQRSVAQLTELLIPWRHHMFMLDKRLPTDIYLWYARKAQENGWSRDILAIQIETNLYARQASHAHITNFERVLDPIQSDLAQQIMKDPYILTFIDEGKDERDTERNLIQHIQKFLLELGKGFAFVGNQYKLDVGTENYYIDLLFYHIKLKCYVALELKVGKFKPEYAGKMQFYLTVLDAQVKDDSDRPSIGIVLCRDKDKVVAQYALQGTTAPMGIASYIMQNKLPASLADSMPTLAEIEKELEHFKEQVDA